MRYKTKQKLFCSIKHLRSSTYNILASVLAYFVNFIVKFGYIRNRILFYGDEINLKEEEEKKKLNI